MSGVAKIADVIRRLETVATPATIQKLSQKLGGVVIKLINEQIDQSVDPYGMPWKPRVDGAPPLKGFRNTFSASVSSNGLKVVSNKWYAVVHQNGWTIEAKTPAGLRFKMPGGQWVTKQSVTIPRRQLVPTASTGLGYKWSAALLQAETQFFRDHLQGVSRG